MLRRGIKARHWGGEVLAREVEFARGPHEQRPGGEAGILSVQARMGVYMRGRRGQYVGNVDARREMPGEVSDDVDYVGQ